MVKITKDKLPSRHVSLGAKSAPHRAYYYAMGLNERNNAAFCWGSHMLE